MQHYKLPRDGITSCLWFVVADVPDVASDDIMLDFVEDMFPKFNVVKLKK